MFYRPYKGKNVMFPFHRNKSVVRLRDLGISEEMAKRLVDQLENMSQDSMEKRLAMIIADGKRPPQR